MSTDFKKALSVFKIAQKTKLKRLVKDGKTPTEMAAAMGVSRQRVHQLLAEFGLKDTQV